LLFTALTVGGFSLVLALPSLRRSGHVPPRIDTLEAGGVEPVALRHVYSLQSDIPKELGGISSWSTHLYDPTNFFFLVPEGSTASKDTAVTMKVPGGMDVPLEVVRGFTNPRGASVQLKREYPPDLDYLDLTVEFRGKPAGKFRVRDLPPTQLLFPTDGLERRRTEVGGVTIEAAAWTHPPRPTQTEPTLKSAIRVTGAALRTGAWDIEAIGTEHPFIEPRRKPIVPVRASPRNVRSGYALGFVRPFSWAYSVPRVRITGELRHFLTVEDELDLGPVQLVPSGKPGKGGVRVLSVALANPRRLRTRMGVEVAVEPVRVAASAYQAGTHLALRLLPGNSATKGLPPALQRKETEATSRFEVESTDRDPWAPNAANQQSGYATVTIRRPDLRAGRHHLRLKLRRGVLREVYPFELRPDVEHRSKVEPETSPGLDRTLAWTMFLPTISDFTASAVSK